jgi:serine/threonine protein kinase
MAEHRNLKAFKQCLDRNTNIMLSYTAFAHDSNFIIISPLADLDLYKFFKGSYPDFQARRRRFTPIALLKESLGLAAALNFLHDGLRMRGGQKVACAHLDLKPENILVKWGATVVGRWKIHDFGTSRIKEPSATTPKVSGLLPGDFLRQFSFTRAGRAPGPFQAPEVQFSQERVVGRESDMWSFGCILAFVLAFAVGGPKHISQLSKTLDGPVLEDTKTDYFYTIDSIDKSKFIIKPKVAEWLKGLKMDNVGKTPWVNDTLDLIFSTLVVDAKARPKAFESLNRLDAVCSEKTDNFDAICSWVPAEEDYGIEILPSVSSPENTQPSSTQSIRETSQPTDGHCSSPNSPSNPTTSGSRLSDTSSRPSNEITETAVFMKLKAPLNTFKTTICPSSCHVAFVSKKLAELHCLRKDMNWVETRPKLITQPMIHAPDVTEIACPDEGYEWNYVCLSDSYVLLRAKDQRSRIKKVSPLLRVRSDCTSQFC